MSQANQQAIADRLGLSRATVSRCFTNHVGISPITRAKVFQVASEIGYTHMETRSSARRGAAAAPPFSALICSDPEEFFHGEYESPGAQILAGVSEFGQLHQTAIDVKVIPPDVADLAAPAFDSIRDDKNRGVLLIYPFAPTLVEQLAARFPLVSLVDQSQHHTIDCVDVDHHAGIASTIDHLLAAGHRRIGFYTRHYPNQASWSFRRYSAFAETMAREEIKVAAKDIIGVFPSPVLGTEQSIAMAAERTRAGVTAWVCAADHQAYDLIRGLRSEQIETPSDISVTGFDGIQNSAPAPPLTTVKIPYRDIGMIGAERLAARMQKPFSGKQRIYISGELKHGDTVGPPRN